MGTSQHNQRQNTSGVQRGLEERWSQRGEEAWNSRFITGLWMERWRYQKALSSAAGEGLLSDHRAEPLDGGRSFVQYWQ